MREAITTLVKYIRKLLISITMSDRQQFLEVFCFCQWIICMPLFLYLVMDCLYKNLLLLLFYTNFYYYFFHLLYTVSILSKYCHTGPILEWPILCCSDLNLLDCHVTLRTVKDIRWDYVDCCNCVKIAPVFNVLVGQYVVLTVFGMFEILIAGSHWTVKLAVYCNALETFQWHIEGLYRSPLLARSHYCQQLTLSVFVSRPFNLLLFCFSMEWAIFWLSVLHMALYKTFFDFWFRPPNAQNLLPKICTKSPISRLVWQIHRRCLGLPGGFRERPIQWNHAKCCGADPCHHGNEISAKRGDPVAYRLVTTVTCNVQAMLMQLKQLTTWHHRWVIQLYFLVFLVIFVLLEFPLF